MKVLICGARGQLGHALLRTRPEALMVEACDRAAMDLSDHQQVAARVQQMRPDLIINAAAYTQVDRAESEPDKAFAVNAEGVRHLAQAARSIDARLLHVSTDFVFDGHTTQPYSVNHVCQPLSVYGASKLAGEQALRQVLPDQHLILRTSWLYSASGHNFVNTMLARMRDGKALRVVADQTGSPTWATGLASVIWNLAQRDCFGRTLHWSDQGATSWYQFAVAIQDEALALGALPQPVSIQPIKTCEYPVAAQRPAYSVLDCSETAVLAGCPRLDWRAQLRTMLQEGLTS